MSRIDLESPHGCRAGARPSGCLRQAVSASLRLSPRRHLCPPCLLASSVRISCAGTRVIGTGDALNGSTVTDLALGASGLNDDGDIAFNYTLASGTTGVAVASLIPEPGSALLLVAAGGTLLSRRRR
jgi:hypothetical protein